MKLADRIRIHSRDKYVLAARKTKVRRFSIRAGDVVEELGIGGRRAPAVCSALKTHQFLRDNELRLIEAQLEGKRAQSGAEFLRGYPRFVGAVLGAAVA